MKRWFSLLLLLLGLDLCPALAADFAIEDAILRLLKETYPQSAPAQIVYDELSAAAVLEADGQKILCVMHLDGNEPQWAVNSPHILFDDRPLPTLSLEHYVLSWQYPDATFCARHNEDGLWAFSEEIFHEFASDEIRLSWQDENGGLLLYSLSQNGNRVAKTLPAGWLADHIPLEAFDVALFPVLESEEYDGQWPHQDFIRDAAADLMPSYTLVGGTLAQGNLQFLMDKPDGTRVFVGCVADPQSGCRLTESTPLPPEASYGVENFPGSLQVNGLLATPCYDAATQRWGIREIKGYSCEAEALELYPDCIVDDHQKCVFGAHPWSDLTVIRWDTLPRTFEEACDVIRPNVQRAMVINPNPGDRLHLRQSPDRSSRSLGKFYTGTQVWVLEAQGDWMRVSVGVQSGWMMKKFLSFDKPPVTDLSILPHPILPHSFADLYDDPSADSLRQTLADSGELYVLGLLGEDWVYVWMPTGKDGYMLRKDLNLPDLR